MMKKANITAVLITLTTAFGLTISALQSCKKEVVQAPVVSVFLPHANQSFGFGDSIWVEAQVSHPNLYGITVTLVNSSFYPVEEVSTVPVKGSSVSFQRYIVIQNKAISSGKHYVRIQVFAQGESFNTFVEVQIAELQKQRLAIYAATTDGTTRNLYRIENGSQVLSSTHFGDVSGLATDGFNGSLFLAPEFYGDLNMYRTPTDSLLWQDANTAGSGAPFMHGLYSANNQVYGLYASGRVVGFAKNGGTSFFVQLPTGYQSIDMLQVENNLWVVGEATPNAQKKLFHFSSSTGALLRSIELFADAEHIALLPFDASTVAVLFNNAAGQAAWEGYQQNGIFTALPNLPNFAFTTAASTGVGKMALGTNMGIYNFTYSPLNFLPVSPIVPTVLVFDELNKQLLVGAGSSLSVRTYPAMQVVSSHSFSSAIKGAAILYNK